LWERVAAKVADNIRLAPADTTGRWEVCGFMISEKNGKKN